MWLHNNVWVASKQSNGQVSVLNSQYQVSGDATLRISNVQTKDNGDFDCQVIFTSGVPPVIQDTAELVVVVSPTITLKTTTAPTLDEGATRTLFCVASGNPKPTYRWYKDSVKIQEDPNNSNYTITSASRNDAGTYRCEAVINVPTLGQYSDSYTVQVTVRFRPVHKTNSLSSNQTVVEGRTTTFLCITEAFPIATTYKWFKDGNEISNSQDFETLKISDTESRLTIKNAKKGSAGQYSCDGTNAVGTGDRKSAFLLVNYAPQQVTVNPNPAVVELGQSLTLTCQADGFPKPSYSWKFNGGAIGDSQNTLQLASAQVLNAGNYTCVATNTFGSAQETRLVNVRYKPTVTTFTTGNPDNNAVQGTSVTLTCTANGYPAPTYTIQRTTPSGTTPLAGTSGGRYTIPNVQLTEEDNSYNCVPRNALGDGPSKSLTVKVIVPPSFQSNLPNKQTKTENETVNYACTVQAKPYAQIVWKLGEKNLTGTPYNITTEVAPVQNSKLLRTLSYLTIDKVTWQQNGTFSCVAFNSAGQRRQTTDLEVRYRPVVQSDADHPKNLTLSEGQEATFSCKTIGNPPTLSQKWQFNGVDIPGESCSACVTTTFTKASVTQADAGWYSCAGTNSLGEGPPARAQLLIKHPPTITFYQSAFTVNETNNVTMICRAKGVPQPTITWTKIGGDKLDCSGEQCTIRNTSGKNDGTYRCVARNELGEVSEGITLNVQTRPIIVTSTPTSTQIPGNEGEQVDLTCIVSGKPPPSLSWKRQLNGQDLSSLSDKVKSITKERDTSVLKVAVSAIGEHFYCVAVNLLGSDNQQYTIRKRGIPDKPINVDVKSFQDQNSKTVSVNVSWTPGYSGGYDQEFTIHYRVKQSNRDFVEQFVGHPDNNMHTIPGLYPETVYEFTVQASNKLGQSQPSDPKEYKTAESQIPPDRGTVKALRASDDASVILVEWTIADDQVTIATLEIQQGGEGSWELVKGAFQLNRSVSEFKVSDLKADSSYRFRMDMRRPGESSPAYVYSDIVPAGPLPGARNDGEPLKDWMIAVIVLVAGLLLLAIVVLALCCFKRRKKEHGGKYKTVYVVGGPDVTRVLENRRSYGMESVEDDPFLAAASMQSVNSTEAKRKTRLQSGCKLWIPPEMLLNPGSRMVRNGRLAQSTGELDANSAYSARGPQRDFSTLPPYHEPPSHVESIEEPGYAAVDRDGRVMGPRVLPMGANPSGRPANGPLDPTVPYALPQKRPKPKRPRREPNEPAIGPPPQYTPEDRSFEDLPVHDGDDLDLDDPSNLPPNEGPPDLPPPMAMLPSNRPISNNYQNYPDDGLPEPPMFLRDIVYPPDGQDPRYDSDGPAPYHPPSSPGRQRQPYINIHGQLVRPPSQDSDGFRRPESLRSSRNTLTPEPELPPNQWQPRGSEPEEKAPEINYVSYLV
ncbi:unnamed protein product [Pocillopora meandrina]|uniref:Uncharacterized protein n=1 Tax=Pocillopora meandrina TaxID=46732 RepID=A0AAU9Y4B9_9CNID|nr:unnamed protein product [Pocillopora meandrina]